MRWRIILVGGAAIAAVAVVAVVYALFTDTQTTTGSLSSAAMSVSNTADLYICEPTGTTGDADCPGDDSGADEIIFEDVEEVLQGDAVIWDIRLRNVGPIPFDVQPPCGINTGSCPGVTVQETFDPGSDCSSEPQFSVFTPVPAFSILGVEGDTANDNVTLHGARFGPSAIFFDFLREDRDGLDPDAATFVHIEPDEFEDVRIRAIFSSLPNECAENVWDVTIEWVADPNQHE